MRLLTSALLRPPSLFASALSALLATAVSPAVSGTDWELLQASPAQSGRHEDVSFADPYTGWVANLGGEIWKTSDGGDTWTRQLAAALPFRALGAATVCLVWAGTLNAGSPLHETTDGGESWIDVSSRISGPPPAGICGISVVNPRTAYAVGRYSGPAHVLKTTDSGHTWESTDMGPYAKTLVDVFFFDELHGFVAGGTDPNLPDGRGVVLETTDGGLTWETRHTTTETGEWCWKFSFPSESVGFVSVENFGFGAKVLKTTDAGATWSEIVILTDPLQGVGFVTETDGWISGGGTTARTTDGGATWSLDPLDGAVNRFRILSPGLGYAVGSRVYKYNDGTTGLPDLVSGPPPGAVTTVPNPFRTSTSIAYDLDHSGRVRLAIYDALGRRVRCLVDHAQAAGSHEVRWNGRSEDGRQVPMGIYFVKLDAAGTAGWRRVTLLP